MAAAVIAEVLVWGSLLVMVGAGLWRLALGFVAWRRLRRTRGFGRLFG